MVKIRRRGAAIIETKKGILVVAWDKKSGFMIPGGGAGFFERRKTAAIREVEEETGLKTKSAKFLFKFLGPEHKNKHGKLQRNHAKVFLLEVSGKPKPLNEIKHLAYWKPGSRIKLMKGAKQAIDIYFKEFKNK